MKNKYCKRDEDGNIVTIFHEPLIHNGEQIFNPSEELMLSLGWEVLVMPKPVRRRPTMQGILNSVATLLNVEEKAEELDDAKAVELKELFPAWSDHIGETMVVGKRYYYDNKLWKVIQQHTSQADWTPSTAVSLFVEVSVEEFPEWKQPVGAADAYNKGDKVSYNGKHYVSDVDNNVWSPDVYGWSEL